MTMLNQVLPNVGDAMSASTYKSKLQASGYNHYQCIGSIGGASNAGTISIGSNKKLTRIR